MSEAPYSRVALRVDIFSLFPGMFAGPLSESIIKRAIAAGQVHIRVHDIRDWTTDKHHTADDTPYGGGAGMVMKAPPIVEAVESVLGDDLATSRILLLSAGGRSFRQSLAHDLALAGRIAMICGHYEGIDQRVVDILGAEEISIGDYVLTGGELPAMVITDAIVRLVPGVIAADSIAEESHGDPDQPLVEYPHYTRPLEYRGHVVPDVLLSGHHAKIAAWRR
ncbi:MAG TPA: tRNA (guanosine(37)-N1)-methyltransferase TrmD, partial [Thermomicrobiales bacterium]|nr:tRNA (guanosine(37)-N1)-methyltransferase TrmD [Thermomicrobiales bacterium]